MLISFINKLAKRIVLVAAILIIWKFASMHVNHVFVPDPIKVWNDFIISIHNKSIINATIYSLRRIFISTLLSALISIPVGLLIYNVNIFKEILKPIVEVIRYLPVTAFYPLLIMWFGIDEVMKVAFLFIASFVYMMPSVLLCLDEINDDLINTGITLGMNRLQLITQVQLPATLPSILNSLIVTAGIGFSYIAVCETVNAKYGLGWIIQQNSSRGRTDMVFMSIIVIAVLSVIFDNLGRHAVRGIFKWKYLKED